MRPVPGAPPVAVSCVLVVDDHRMFAELLAHRLRREAAIEHAQVACTVQQARAAVGARAPDVVLLDPYLERGAAVELLGDLRLLENRPRVVVLADPALEPPSTVELDPHCCGWISKESPFEDLVETIEAVRRGQPPRPPARRHAEASADGSYDLATTGPVLPMQRDGLADDDPRVRQPRLTARQAEVLQCLVGGMTRAEISTRLGLSPHTVRDHVRHLFGIAGVTCTTDLVGWAEAGELARPRRARVVHGP
jgi:DNA-binding NarL/FixJ family response regulator